MQLHTKLFFFFFVVLWSRLAGRSVESYENWSFFSQVCGQVKGQLILEQHKKKSVICSCVPNYFYFVLWQRLASRSAQTYGKWLFFSIFSRVGPFPQVFPQDKELPMLKMYKIIRMSDVLAWLIVFPLFYERGSHGGVFKVIKNDHFLVFLAVWGLIPKYLGWLKSGVY